MTEPARFALVPFEKDGLLLDLSSGSLFHLNESAAMVWARFLEGTPAGAVAEALSNRYRLPLATASEHVSGALLLDNDSAQAKMPVEPFVYGRAADVYTLSRGGTPLVTMDARGHAIRLCGPDAVAAQELPLVLYTVAPKVMALRGHFVLHASSVALNGTLIAFCGKSGAGKTTTGRALVRAGAVPISEDKLVINLHTDRIDGFVDGERSIISWVREAAIDLAAGRAASCDRLDQAATGRSAPLGAIGFLDATRRNGRAFTARILGHSKAASALFSNAFHGSDLPEDWRQHLETAARAVRLISTYDVTAPQGVETLQSAAADVVGRGAFP
jgi:hypothetical protein